MKVLLGLTEIAGYYVNLKKGFQEIGVNCEFINLTPHPFKYGGDDVPNSLVALLRYCGLKRVSTPRTSILPKVFWIGCEIFLRLVFFLWALLRYDVFIFGFHTSFLGFYDLPILKLLNKKVIYMHHGSDSRPPYFDGFVMVPGKGIGIKKCISLTKKKKRNVQIIDKYADVIINYPPMAHFHQRGFVLGLVVGLPFSLDKARMHGYNNKDNGLDGSTVRILHSPSDPEAKGTAIIHQVIERLKQKGYQIDFIEIIGQPNEVVLYELSRCDFIVDQLYSDTPMAGFATEAAFFGKPAVVGGYYSKMIRDDIPVNAIPPSLFCHPDEIESGIEKMIVDVDYRTKLGIEAHKFVIENWSAKKVAEKYLRIINGDIPSEWLYDPNRIKYVHGAGLPEQRVKEIIREMVRIGTKDALQLQDKAALEKMMLDFINSD